MQFKLSVSHTQIIVPPVNDLLGDGQNASMPFRIISCSVEEVFGINIKLGMRTYAIHKFREE